MEVLFMEEQNLPLRLSRRAFLCAAATTVGTIAFGSLITACGSQAPGAPEPTAAPAPEATAAPGAPEPTAAPGAPEATAAPEPTAAPAVPAEQSAPAAESGLPVSVPRESVLVVDQIFRYSVVDNFNFFVSGPPSPTRQGLVYDTLWYLDQQTGEWINALAEDKPQYNADSTEMTVKLRKGIMWSDGVEFSADDVVYTVTTLKGTPGLTWSAEMNLYVKDVQKTDDSTVVFTLNEANPRFHAFFTARYNAVYIMAKHVWEKASDIKTFANFPPVSLGAYVPQESDPNGFWELFKRRDDWQQTTVGLVNNKPGPEYILSIFYGDSAKKAIAVSRHNLDILFDADIEAFDAIRNSTPSFRSWFADFPWAYPNELDYRYFGPNHGTPPYDNKDVRWALALATDVVDLQTNYIGGVTRITPIPLPATGLLMQLYHEPMEPWLKELTLDIGNGETFQPYDADVPKKVAAWAREQGYVVPEDSDAAGLRDRFGMGWWKYDPEVAGKLLTKAGFSKGGDGTWLKPDGQPWTIKVLAAPDENDVYRLAIGFQDQMKTFGVDVEVEALERQPYTDRQNVGDFEITSSWGLATPNANPDLWQGLNSVHSRFFTPVGTSTAGTGSANIVRFKAPEIDTIVDELSKLSPEDPKVSELGQQAMKYWVENMLTIPTISFKKFTSIDETYWTNWPTAENPKRQPLYWFMGGRFTFADVEPKG
jgi:peptide/nickel transport system substrate-binding protein